MRTAQSRLVREALAVESDAGRRVLVRPRRLPDQCLDLPVTRYFTFGYEHRHMVGGETYDRDTIVRVTAPDPRSVMLRVFGRAWCWECDETEKNRLVAAYGLHVKDLVA